MSSPRNPYALEAKQTPQQVIPDRRHAKRSKAQRKRDAESEALNGSDT